MRGIAMVAIWIACVLVGAGLGFLAGWAIWKLGFELIGSAVTLVGAAAGGIGIFLWLMSSDFAQRWQ